MLSDSLFLLAAKRERGVRGPTLGKRSIIFIDDMNMPQPEVYGARPPIELLRQWMDHDGWYQDNEFLRFVDIQVRPRM